MQRLILAMTFLGGLGAFTAKTGRGRKFVIGSQALTGRVL